MNCQTISVGLARRHVRHDTARRAPSRDASSSPRRGPSVPSSVPSTISCICLPEFFTTNFIVSPCFTSSRAGAKRIVSAHLDAGPCASLSAGRRCDRTRSRPSAAWRTPSTTVAVGERDRGIQGEHRGEDQAGIAVGRSSVPCSFVRHSLRSVRRARARSPTTLAAYAPARRAAESLDAASSSTRPESRPSRAAVP